MSALPDHPAELIRVALADLKLVEADDRYVANMDWWHVPNKDVHGRCSVCLAGAVMAKHLGQSPSDYILPNEAGETKKLLALNAFRSGYICDAFDILDIAAPDSLGDDRLVPGDNPKDPAPFHAAMHKLADDIEQAVGEEV